MRTLLTVVTFVLTIFAAQLIRIQGFDASSVAAEARAQRTAVVAIPSLRGTIRSSDGVVLASGVTLAGAVRVEAGTYLGQSCTVRQFQKIGAGSLIGMGAVVVDDVAPKSVMIGNPARLLRHKN